LQRLTEIKRLNENGVPQQFIYAYQDGGSDTADATHAGNTVKHFYDKKGNLISKEDEDGFTTLYEYNMANAITKVSFFLLQYL